jgi:hypothetical protein
MRTETKISIGTVLTTRETVGGVADAITICLDEETSRALAVLTRDGTAVAVAVRAALVAAHEQARVDLLAEG